MPDHPKCLICGGPCIQSRISKERRAKIKYCSNSCKIKANPAMISKSSPEKPGRTKRKKIPGMTQVILEDPELIKWLEWKLDQSGVEYQVINGEYIWNDKPDPIIDNYPLTDQEEEYLILLLRVFYLNEEYPYESI